MLNVNFVGVNKFCPTRPERAEAPSPGQRPGYYWHIQKRPVRAKALKTLESFCPYRATLLIAAFNPGCCPGLGASALSGRVKQTYLRTNKRNLLT